MSSLFRYNYKASTTTAMVGASEDESRVSYSAMVEIAIASPCNFILKVFESWVSYSAMVEIAVASPCNFVLKV